MPEKSPEEFREKFRIEQFPPYVFAEVNRLKEEARQRGADIIDLGMGNPDLPPPDHVIAKLIEVVSKPRVHRYSASRGIVGLRRAQAAYYERRFGVALDSDREVVVTLGSKEGFVNMAQAICRTGTSVLVPSPAYPIHTFGFILAGASVHQMKVAPGPDFHEEFLRTADQAIHQSIPKPIAIVVNFPCNPTAQVGHLDFYRELVAIARRHDVFILSDLAYAEIYFGDKPPSMLQVDQAKDVVVEFTSMSKTYSMPGWRIGFAVGNERLIAALGRVKSYVDYGAFTPIQAAAATALNGPQECVAAYRAIYRRRHATLVESMARAGWEIPVAAATMFAWVPVPSLWRDEGSLAFSKILLEEAELAVSPGSGFGENGEGYVRISLVENEQRIRQAARNVRRLFEQKGRNQ